MSFIKSLPTKLAEVKKELAAAAAVLVAIGAVGGVPASVQGYIAAALGVLATFGVTYGVTNKPKA